MWHTIILTKEDLEKFKTLIVPAFSGSVVSYLTADKPKIPFTDLDTFVKDGTYKLAFLKVSQLISYFNVSTVLPNDFEKPNKKESLFRIQTIQS